MLKVFRNKFDRPNQDDGPKNQENEDPNKVEKEEETKHP